MGKNKLKKFQEMQTFHNVYQCAMRELQNPDAPVSLKGHWHEQVFHNTNPIVLELGCGRGEYTVGLAERCADKNYIGIDIKGARMWAGAKQAELAGMKNVAFLRTNIEMLPLFFAPEEVSEIWITFPDPQMKKATKRLTSTFFLARYQQLLLPSGLIRLKTDSPFLYTYTREVVRANNLPVLADTADLYGPWTDDAVYDDAKALQTHYELQWLDRGMTIKYLAFRLQAPETWQEPDIDIEKDTYRSYGRNYVPSTNH